MKQLFQDLKGGEVFLADTPVPKRESGEFLCQTLATLVSSGTERMLMDFGKAGWIGKARQQPEKVLQVVDKVKTDGLAATWQSVSNRLEQAVPLGYCNVGMILEGDPAKLSEAGITTGSRVVSNSPHAEFFCAKPTCCAVVPDNVSDQDAAFTVLGAVGLEGIRLAQPTLGEYFAVIGLGLIGLLSVQILQANGCRVLGLDIDQNKCDLARSFGAETILLTENKDPLPEARAFTNGRLLDGVLITAATNSSEVMSQAAAMCRKRGRMVLIGTAGLNLKRSDFYEKELSFQVSCAYGPGRYDPTYEEKGQDYPLPYVRWTMKRNFEAVLGLMADGKLDIGPLATHSFEFTKAPEAFEVMALRENHLGILLEYDKEPRPAEAVTPKADTVAAAKCGKPTIGILGAGVFASNTLLPFLAKSGHRLRSIVSRHGSNAALCARRFGIEQAFSQEDQVFGDPAVNTLFILTRHNLHAAQAIEALRSGRNIYLEKPLCLNQEEQNQIMEAYEQAKAENHGLVFMLGFNRRFAPLVQEMKGVLSANPGPKSMAITVNAGVLPQTHWLLDPEVGGGRIVGEGIHFIDLMMYLAASPVVEASMTPTGKDVFPQSAFINMKFEDGSAGCIQYLSEGHKSYPKERIEVFWDEKVLQLDNYKKLNSWGMKSSWKDFLPALNQDKGHKASVTAFLEAITTGKPSPIDATDIWRSSEIALGLLQSGNWKVAQ